MSLGDHLGADEDVNLARRESGEHGGQGAAAADGVTVEPGHASAWTRTDDLGLHPLGAVPDLLEIRRGAGRT